MDERSDRPTDRHDERPGWPRGPMGQNASTESVGDPEAEATDGAAAGHDDGPGDPSIVPASAGTGPTDPMFDPRHQPTDDPHAPGGRG